MEYRKSWCIALGIRFCFPEKSRRIILSFLIYLSLGIAFVRLFKSLGWISGIVPHWLIFEFTLIHLLPFCL